MTPKPIEEVAREICIEVYGENDGYHFTDSHPLIAKITQALRNQIERDAKIAEDHYEAHCCEDCPCDYWRKETAEEIRSQK